MVGVLDKIRNITFVVNGGSGVLVQAMTRAYSYVVTAKHVIQVDKNIPENGLLPIEDISIHTPDDTEVIAKSVYPHPALDLAIIIVDYIETSIRLYECDVNFDDQFILFGYPNFNDSHRNPALPRREWIESYSLNVLDTTDEKTKMRLSEDAQHSDIEGFSGGGIFCIDNDEVYLVGIENESIKAGEYVNRVISIPITNVNKIIEEAILQPIKPAFFGELLELQPEIFEFENCFSPQNIKKATDILKSQSTNLLQNCEFSPFEVLKSHREIVSDLNESELDLENQEFWISFLELLHVEGMISPEVAWDEEFLNIISRTYKFVYISSRQGWKSKFPQILSTNVEHLRVGGKLLLVEFGQMPNSPDQLNYFRDNIPSDVSNGIEEEDIAHVNSMLQKSISIVHLPKLHEHCIAERENEFGALDRITQREQIKALILQGYTEYLAVEETDNE